MMIEGQWLENITCPQCRHRHPAEVSGERADAIAKARREERESEQRVEENAWDGLCERRDYSEFAKLVLGEERYNDSPCQVHPFELILDYVRQLEAL